MVTRLKLFDRFDFGVRRECPPGPRHKHRQEFRGGYIPCLVSAIRQHDRNEGMVEPGDIYLGDGYYLRPTGPEVADGVCPLCAAIEDPDPKFKLVVGLTDGRKLEYTGDYLGAHARLENFKKRADYSWHTLNPQEKY